MCTPPPKLMMDWDCRLPLGDVHPPKLMMDWDCRLPLDDVHPPTQIDDWSRLQIDIGWCAPPTPRKIRKDQDCGLSLGDVLPHPNWWWIMIQGNFYERYNFHTDSCAINLRLFFITKGTNTFKQECIDLLSDLPVCESLSICISGW